MTPSIYTAHSYQSRIIVKLQSWSSSQLREENQEKNKETLKMLKKDYFFSLFELSELAHLGVRQALARRPRTGRGGEQDLAAIAFVSA